MSVILVTGGLGVIGAWVTRELIEQGHKVISYSRHIDTTLVRDIADRIIMVTGDITDFPQLIYTLKQHNVDRIAHLAAILPKEAEANPRLGFKINVGGTLNVFEACRILGIRRVVATSSRGVLGILPDEYGHPTYKLVDEDVPRNPCTVYGTTKVFMENVGLDFNRIYGLDFIALRFSSPYGIGRQARHGAFSITSKVIESAMLGKPLSIPQGAEEMDDFIYIKDVANSIVLALSVDRVEHRIFNVGAGKADSLKHMIYILKGIYGDIPVTIGPGLNYFGGPNSNWFTVFNIERASKELGYGPQYDLEAGVKDYIASMQKLGIRPEVLD